MTALAQTFAQRRGRRSARSYIVALVAAILIPALILAGWLAVWSAQAERSQIVQSAQNQTREGVAAIDREIIASQNVLSVLATSPFLRDGNLEAFYDQALTASRQLGLMIVLFDRRLNRQVMNTEFPFDAVSNVETPDQRTQAETELGRLRVPQVSNVFFGPRVKQQVVAIVVPVLRGEEVPYSLSAGLPVARFSGILDSLNIDPDQIVSVIDRGNTVVARSSRHAEFAGTQIANTIPAENSSINIGTNRDGIPFHWFNRRSPVTGWIVSVGVPTSVLEAPSRRAWFSFSIAGTLLFVVAIGLSYHWGGRLSQSVGALGIDRKPTREEFEVLFDSAPNGVMVIGPNGIILLVNARLEKKFGYPKAELVGQPVEVLVPERLRGKHLELRRAFGANPEARPMGAGRELFGRRKDGSEFPIEIALNPISAAAGNLVLVTVVDISARKLSEERLAAAIVERDESRRRFLQALEQERVRLARELHDQTGQALTAALLELKRIETSVRDGSEERLRRLRQQMEEMGKTLHQVAWELRPASIDELGLAAALDHHIVDWSAQSGIEADFYYGDIRLDELPDEIRTTIYRLIQEGLTNVARHARLATGVSVVIERGAPGLRLMIEDDGCGFEPETPRENNGKERRLGIAGMRERLALIGGSLEIESSVGGGTTLFAKIPLAAGAPAA